MEEKAQKESKSTRAQTAACAPARHWHCPTITQLTFFAPTTAKTVQSSSRERARPAMVTYFPPRAWPRGWTPPTPNWFPALARGWRCWRDPIPRFLGDPVRRRPPGKKRPEPSGSGGGSAAGRKAPSRGAAYSDKCRTDPGSGALSSRVPVRSGLRRYVAQDHDPWCPFVCDGATSAAGAWDQIIPQQMDPNSSWEVLFFWKDFELSKTQRLKTVGLSALFPKSWNIESVQARGSAREFCVFPNLVATNFHSCCPDEN